MNRAVKQIFLIVLLLLNCCCAGYAQPPITTGLKLHLDAAVGFNNMGAGIPSTWADQSGYGNTVTAGTTNPMLTTNAAGSGFAGIYFNGTDNYMYRLAATANGFTNPGGTMFVVRIGQTAANTISSFYRTTVSFGEGNTYNNEFAMMGNWAIHTTVDGVWTDQDHQCYASLPDTLPVVLCGTVDSGTAAADLHFYVNGIQSTQSLYYSGSPVNLIHASRSITVGGRFDTPPAGHLQPGTCFEGYILEVLAYDRILSNAEVDSVNNYLKCKYNVHYAACNTASCQQNIDSAHTCFGQWTPVVNQTFGQGAGANQIFFSPLNSYAPGVTTSATFVTNTPVADYAALTFSTLFPGNTSCNVADHTGNTKGLMLEVNAPANINTTLLKYTMRDLCPNTLFKMSVWLLNADATGTIPPRVAIQAIDSATHIVLDSLRTGDISFNCGWHNYTMLFNNGNASTVTFQMIDSATNNGNHIAVDDFTVNACVAVTHISPKINTAVCQSQNASFLFTAKIADNSYPVPEYQWQYSPDTGLTWINALPAGPANNYTFTNSVPGTYWIRFLAGPLGSSGNIACTAISDISIVTVEATPPIPAALSVNYCQGAHAVALTTINGLGLLWYSTLTGGIGSPAAPIPSTAQVGYTTYYVSQTPFHCESARRPIYVNVYPKAPTPIVTTPIIYCTGQIPVALNISANILNGATLWYSTPTGGTGSYYAPTPSTAIADTVNYYVTQNYWFQAALNGCESDRAKITVVTNQTPPAPDMPDITLCKDYIFAAPDTTKKLLWYANATGGTSAQTPGSYVIDTTIGYVSQVVKGCESSRSPVQVAIVPVPAATINAAMRPYLCQGDTMSFFYGSNPQNIRSFIWSLPPHSAIINNGQGTKQVVARFNAPGNNTIMLTTTNAGCSATSAYSVSVYPRPIATITTNPDICVNQQTKVTIQQTATGATYHTYLGGANVIDSSSSAFGIYNVQWSNPGTYTVSVSVESKECPAETITDTVNVHDLPIAAIATPKSQDVCSGDTILLSAQAADTKNSYEWQPKRDIANNTGIEASAIVATTEYIQLQVTAAFSCTATDSLLITTHPCCEIYLPTAFTPNDDGHNDIFRIISTGHHQLSDFRIVNRWGQTVFQTDNESEGWKGTFNGIPQDMGTYDYYIKYLCSDGKFYEKKGDVILVR